MTKCFLYSQSSRFDQASKPTEDKDGVPIRLYRKEMIKKGEYIHPKTKKVINVTDELMDEWIENFGKMQENGVRIPIPVDHSFDAEKSKGQLIDMFRDGDSLYGIHELAGDDIPNLLARCPETSIYCDESFVDGKGNKYGRSILHNSIVQMPVVPGQTGFEQVSAFAASHNAEVFVTGEIIGDDNVDELINSLKNLLGLDELDKDTAIEAIQQRISQSDEAKAKTEDLEKQVEELKNKLEQAKKEEKPKIASETLEVVADAAQMELDSYVNNGDITTAVAASIRGMFIGAEGERNAMMLSMLPTGEDGRKKTMLSQVLPLFKQNKAAIDAGEASGAQALSHQGKQGDGAPDLIKAAMDKVAESYNKRK